MGIIHNLLNLLGFHNIADKHYNKDEHHPVKESALNDVVFERLWECMRPTRPRIDSPDCPYDVHKCKIRAKELAKHDGCPYHDELWGCSISPGKSCNGCYNNKHNCI